MSKLQGHLPPIQKGHVSDPSPARRPPLTPQHEWTRKQMRKDRLFQRFLFLGTTRFKLVTRRAHGGPAELLRMIFSYGNIHYDSLVLGNIDWKSLITKTPHGNLPVLWVDHNVYGEPTAIARHLASHLGLLGRSESERLVVEAVWAQLRDAATSGEVKITGKDNNNKQCYAYKDGILYRHYTSPNVHFGNTRKQVIVPKGLRVTIMKLASGIAGAERVRAVGGRGRLGTGEIQDSDYIQKAFDEICEKRIDDNAEHLLEVMVPKNFKFWDKHIEDTPGPYITGSGISVADLAIYDFLKQYLDYLPMLPELKKHPNLENLYQTVPTHPSLSSHHF